MRRLVYYALWPNQHVLHPNKRINVDNQTRITACSGATGRNTQQRAARSPGRCLNVAREAGVS